MNVLKFPLERCAKPQLAGNDGCTRTADILFFPGVRYSELEKPAKRQAKSRKLKSQRKSS